MYLKVASSNPTPAPASVVMLPTIITAQGVTRGMGVLFTRGRGAPVMRRPLPGLSRYGLRRLGLRGLGDEVTGSGSFLLSSDLRGYESNLPYQIEQGIVLSPAQVAANISQDVAAYCGQWPAKCPGGAPDVSGAIADYTAKLQAAQAATPNRYYQAPAAAPAAVTPPPAAPPPPAGLPLGVTIQNLSGGSNSQFKVGDQWRLTITGPANSPVTGDSTHNGSIGAPAPFGNTDSSGRAVLTGSMDSGTVGNWAERWFVAGQPAGSLSFSVVAPPPPAGSSSGAGSSSQQQAPPPPPAGDVTALFKSNVNLFGFDFPLWALIAAGGIGIYAASSSSGRGH